jgi:hypothetical protein
MNHKALWGSSPRRVRPNCGLGEEKSEVRRTLQKLKNCLWLEEKILKN